MGISTTFEFDENMVAHLAEECETNSSSFIKKFCKKLLKKIAVETREIGVEAEKLNKINPYGFPF